MKPDWGYPGNEGVYGLQRAFKIAGVRYLIMSLWQVPDRETMQFMTTFYGHWLGEGKPIPEAFRQTQREMRIDSTIRIPGLDSSCWINGRPTIGFPVFTESSGHTGKVLHPLQDGLPGA